LLTAYWGETEKMINNLINWAAVNGGIIIIDEIERFLWKRGQYVSDDYTPKVTATFLDAMDNPLVRDKLFIVIMTTNMPQLVDDATKRPGRVFKVVNIDVMSDARKNAIIAAFEQKYGITLTQEEREELKRLVIVGDDVRFYFECRRNEGSHEWCMDYVKSIAEIRKQTQQTPMVF